MADLEERLRELFREDAARFRARIVRRTSSGARIARLLFAGLGSAAVMLLAIAAGQSLLAYRVGTPAALASSTPAPTPARCDALASIAPAPAAPLAVTDLGIGQKRVTSEEGGWSLEVPASWIVQPGLLGSRAFGQAAITSYDPTGLDYSGMIGPNMHPPTLGVRLHVEVWENPSGQTPEQYAASLRIAPDQVELRDGGSVALAGTTAYRATVQEDRRFQREPNAPIESTKQSRMLWVVPTLRADRLLVLYAWPLENPLWRTAEAIVSTLRLSPPVASRVPVLHHRDEVLRPYLFDKSGAPIPGRRAEAKLVTYAESLAHGVARPAWRIDRDPDELVWIVAVSGPDLPIRRSGPFREGGGTPAPIRWMVAIAPATGDAPGPGSWSQASPVGDWPSYFDAITDRCR